MSINNFNDNFDAILYFDNINEGVDDRNYATSPRSGSPKPIKGQYANYIDPKLYASWSYGRQIRNEISQMGTGFSAEVSDFGQEVVVKVSFNDTVTGRTSSKTFLIIFTDLKGQAYIKTHSNKWRSVSGIGQATSYIKSVCSQLMSSAQQKL